MELCPCGSGKAFLDCCQRFISGQQLPATPEELMRSRYSAYTLADIEYIFKTMKGPASEDFDPESSREWAKKITWLKLEVLNSTLFSKQKGFVEFLAHYMHNNKNLVLHEISEFQFDNGQWYYFDGVTPEKDQTGTKKIPRNDPCPCGSTKKFKKCCGSKI